MSKQAFYTLSPGHLKTRERAGYGGTCPYNPSTQEAEAEGSVTGQYGATEFEASLDYVGLSLKGEEGELRGKEREIKNVCGGQKLTSDAFLFHSPPYFFFFQVWVSLRIWSSLF